MQDTKRWSVRVLTVAGIGIEVHATFLLLLAWVAFSDFNHGSSAAAIAEGLALVLAMFATVVLHELGHALTAKRFGIRTRNITLYPIGGIARLERMPQKPVEELLVALAGPAVNVGLGALLWLGLRLAHAQLGSEVLSAGRGHFAARLMWLNLSLVMFNLLPAFPMDGGRVLRALLALRMDRVRATAIAARVGRGFAIVLAVIGFFANPVLLLIAIFVWVSGQQEAAAEQVKATLADVTVGEATITEFRTLSPGDPLSKAADAIVHGFQRDFLVTEGHRVAGLITASDVMTALAQDGPAQRVGVRMRTKLDFVQASEPLQSVFERLRACDAPMVVLDGPELRGLLSPDNVSQCISAKSATDTPDAQRVKRRPELEVFAGRMGRS